MRILLATLVILFEWCTGTAVAESPSPEDWKVWLRHSQNSGKALEAKNYTEAIREETEALSIAKSLNDRFYIRNSLNDLANAYLNVGDFAQAERYLKKLLVVDAGSTELDHDLSKLAAVYQHWKKFDLAESTFKEAIASAEQNSLREGEIHLFVVSVHKLELVCCYLEEGKTHDADALMESIREPITLQAFGMPHNKAFYFLTDAKVQAAKKNIDQAVALYQKAIAELAHCSYCGSADITVMEEYAMFLETNGRRSQADEVREKIRNQPKKTDKAAPTQSDYAL